MIKTLAFCFTVVIWLLFRTLRLRYRSSVPEANPYAIVGSERFLFSLWHDSMIIPVFGGRHQCSTGLTSQHADGSFVAQVLKLRRISAIRGSTKRISTGALRDLMHRIEDRHIVITPDGPRGPNRQMSAGIAYLASRTGRGIVPTAFACSRSWRIKGSWSDLIIPKPFAKVVMLGGSPIYIPAGLSSAELKAQVENLQQAMDRLQEAAERQLAADAAEPEWEQIVGKGTNSPA